MVNAAGNFLLQFSVNVLPLTIKHLPFTTMRIFAFFLLLFAFASAACRPAAAPVSISNKAVTVNRGAARTNLPMPPSKNIESLGWQNFDGKQQTIGDLKGKVIVLDFWATYCPPCLEEIPHLVKLQNENADSLQVVGLHVGGEEDRPKVPAFVEKLKINYLLAYPDESLMDTLLGSDDAIPQTFVFDKNGKLVKQFTGFSDEIKFNLDLAIQEALNKS
jgi:thiol-disulfide isomerase/thioredoxin